MVGVRIYGRTGEALRQYTLPWNFGRNRYPGRRECTGHCPMDQWQCLNHSIHRWTTDTLSCCRHHRK